MYWAVPPLQADDEERECALTSADRRTHCQAQSVRSSYSFHEFKFCRDIFKLVDATRHQNLRLCSERVSYLRFECSDPYASGYSRLMVFRALLLRDHASNWCTVGVRDPILCIPYIVLRRPLVGSLSIRERPQSHTTRTRAYAVGACVRECVRRCVRA